MNKIKSFTIDHKMLVPGIYLSREDCGTITYDLRLVKPNSEDIPSGSALHTIEHLAATFMRNSKHGSDIVYFGPMGCRTGCYLITSDKMLYTDTIDLIKNAFLFISNYHGVIPGSSEDECGNYRYHDLYNARQIASNYFDTIKNWSIDKLNYPL